MASVPPPQMELSPDYRACSLMWELHGDPVGRRRELVDLPAAQRNSRRMGEYPADADPGRQPGDGQRACPWFMRQNAAFEFGEGAALVTGIDLRSAPSTFPKASG